MRPSFYDNKEYRKRQAEHTKLLWKSGKYDFKIKSESRICQNPKCKQPFLVKPHQGKKFCSFNCAAIINNQKRSRKLNKDALLRSYASGLSISGVANKLGVSEHKVTYWMDQYEITRRSIGDALYLSKHPNGDPFCFKPPTNIEAAKLLGLGLGLYWGEGNKLNKTSIRLTNTDPELIKMFMKFLVELFQISKEDLRFSLQIFTDMDINEALEFWVRELKVRREQFYKTIVTKSGSLGTYRKKSEYGVIILYYHNRKLRDLLVGMLPKWLSDDSREPEGFISRSGSVVERVLGDP